jgi:HAD superfamily hydrolase (TIGR01509 family)
VQAVVDFPASLPLGAVPDWELVQTVCLDGTVLDLRFDNLFWLEVLPRRWGEARGLDGPAASAQLESRFEAKRGTLEWYCIDHWSAELDFDIAALKRELSQEIRYLPGAPAFLQQLRALGKRVLLTTNAHPISLAIKDGQAGLAGHFDALVSSHEFGVPKESTQFWARLAQSHRVDPAATLFVDDSGAVIAAAQAAGVRWIYQVLQPDSTRPLQRAAPGVTGIRRLADLLG